MTLLKLIVYNTAFVIALICTNPSSAFDEGCVHGNGIITSATRSVAHFHGITIQGAFDVFVQSGKKFNLKIISERNLLPYILTETKGSSLHIRTTQSICATDALKIVIDCPDLKWLKAEGSNEIHITGIKAQNFSLELRGASDAIIKGAAYNSSIKLDGAGDLDAWEFKVKNLWIRLSGSGDALIWAEKHLEALIYGTGSILYKGNPSVTKKIVGDAGSIERL